MNATNKRTGFYVAGNDRIDAAGLDRFRVAVGPFRERADAERYVEPLTKRAMEIDPLADVFGTIGTAEMNAETLPAAPGNRFFGLALDADGFVLTASAIAELAVAVRS